MISKDGFDERQEQIRKVRNAIENHIANTKWDGRTHWGPWSLHEGKQRWISYEWVNPHGALIPDLYDIPLRRVVGINSGFDTIEDWAFHLLGKSWTTVDEVLQLVEALCCLYNAGVCGEQEKV